MIRVGLVCTICMTIALPAWAANARFERMLRQLDPDTRLEQACSLSAMDQIRRTPKKFRPDRAVMDAISDAVVVGDTMRGTGGAFRSNGHWYQFSYTCKTSPDRINVLSFDFQIGAAIPEDKWESYGLWR